MFAIVLVSLLPTCHIDAQPKSVDLAANVFKRMVEAYGDDTSRSKALKSKIEYTVSVYNEGSFSYKTNATIVVSDENIYSDMFLPSDGGRYTRAVTTRTDAWGFDSDGKVSMLTKEQVQRNVRQWCLGQMATPYGKTARENCSMSIEGTEKIGDSDHIVLSISPIGSKDNIKLYIDAGTYLVRKEKEEISGVTVAREHQDYVRISGVSIAMKNIVSLDGVKGYERKITSIDFLEKVDEAVFIRPK